jgi:hypothetical protein
MPVAPVGLDREATVRPCEIHLDSSTGQLDPRVDERRWEALRAAEREEPALQLIARHPGQWVDQLERRLKSTDPASAFAARDHLLERAAIENLKPRSAREDRLDALDRCGLREIQERAGHRSARDARDDSEIGLSEGGGVMEADAGPVTEAPRCRHVDERPRPAINEILELPARAVGEGGAGAAGEDGGQPVALRPKHRMADGVDAAVERHQPSTRHAAANRGAREPEAAQLPEAHHSVLTRRDRRDPFIHPARCRGVWNVPSHIGTLCCSPRHGREGPGFRASGGALNVPTVRRDPAAERALELHRDRDRDVVAVAAGGDLDAQR